MQNTFSCVVVVCFARIRHTNWVMCWTSVSNCCAWKSVSKYASTYTMANGLENKMLGTGCRHQYGDTQKQSPIYMKRNPYFYGLLLGKPQAMWGLRVFLFWKWSETGSGTLFSCCAAKKFKRCSSVRGAMTRKSESNYEKHFEKKCGAQKMYVRTFTPMVGWNGKYFFSHSHKHHQILQGYVLNS